MNGYCTVCHSIFPFPTGLNPIEASKKTGFFFFDVNYNLATDINDIETIRNRNYVRAKLRAEVSSIVNPHAHNHGNKFNEKIIAERNRIDGLLWSMVVCLLQTTEFTCQPLNSIRRVSMNNTSLPENLPEKKEQRFIVVLIV